MGRHEKMKCQKAAYEGEITPVAGDFPRTPTRHTLKEDQRESGESTLGREVVKNSSDLSNSVSLSSPKEQNPFSSEEGQPKL